MTLTAQDLSIDDRLHKVSLALKPGQITAICGPNGAGKSTLLEALAGLLPPDDGAVNLGDSNLATLHPRERAKRIGFLPQAHEIAWDVPVRSLIELGRMPHGDTCADPIDAAIRALDIGLLENRRAQSLSGGETARVLLARVLAGEPAWILADEPLAALDIGHQLALLRHLRAAADLGAGVVLVLHDLAHAMNYADRVIVLSDGRLAADGEPHAALDVSTLQSVWKVDAQWIGADGKRALIAR